MRKKKKKLHPFQIFNFVFLTGVCVICMLPFINLLAISFSGPGAVLTGQVGLWPVDFTFSSYQFALQGDRFLRSLWNSVERAVLGTLISLTLSVLTAYPLSRTGRQLPGRNGIMVYFAFTMIFGGGLIPTYIVVSRLGLKNTIWALVLPGGLSVYNMLILMNFIRGIPSALEEAAIIDGASPIQVLLRVMLPLLKPALATIGLFYIVGHWNDWFSGMIYMNDVNKFPLQTYLQSLLVDFDRLLKEQGMQADAMKAILGQMNARTGRAAQLFLGSLPVILIYPFLQKYFTKGLVLGSVKG